MCVLDRKITTAVQLNPFCLHFSALHSLCFGKIYTIRRRRLLSASSLFRFCAVHLRHLLSHKAGAAEAPFVFCVCIRILLPPLDVMVLVALDEHPEKKATTKEHDVERRRKSHFSIAAAAPLPTLVSSLMLVASEIHFFSFTLFFPFQILIYITY